LASCFRGFRLKYGKHFLCPSPQALHVPQNSAFLV
jgi:hypothetical protein